MASELSSSAAFIPLLLTLNKSLILSFSGKASFHPLREDDSPSVVLRFLGTELHGPRSEVQALLEFLLGSFAIARNIRSAPTFGTRTCAPQEELRIGRAGRQPVLHDSREGLDLLGPVRIFCRIGCARRGMP